VGDVLGGRVGGNVGCEPFRNVEGATAAADQSAMQPVIPNRVLAERGRREAAPARLVLDQNSKVT